MLFHQFYQIFWIIVSNLSVCFLKYITNIFFLNFFFFHIFTLFYGYMNWHCLFFFCDFSVFIHHTKQQPKIFLFDLLAFLFCFRTEFVFVWGNFLHLFFQKEKPKSRLLISNYRNIYFIRLILCIYCKRLHLIFWIENFLFSLKVFYLILRFLVVNDVKIKWISLELTQCSSFERYIQHIFSQHRLVSRVF